jgi:hypothetical protein
MYKRLVIVFTLLAIFFAACQQSQKDSATLRGKLLVKDPDNAMPAHDNAIYLVPLTSDQTVIMSPTINFDTAIQAKVDNKTGKFVFSQIATGKYLMMIVTIYDTQIPAHTMDGNLAVVQVKDSDIGKTIDLGDFVVP